MLATVDALVVGETADDAAADDGVGAAAAVGALGGGAEPEHAMPTTTEPSNDDAPSESEAIRECMAARLGDRVTFVDTITTSTRRRNLRVLRAPPSSEDAQGAFQSICCSPER